MPRVWRIDYRADGLHLDRVEIRTMSEMVTFLPSGDSEATNRATRRYCPTREAAVEDARSRANLAVRVASRVLAQAQNFGGFGAERALRSAEGKMAEAEALSRRVMEL